MPLIIMSIFQGNLTKNFQNRDFLDSQKPEILHLKHLILKAARLAFHYTLEARLVYYDEIGDYAEFLKEITEYDRDWYFGSEEYLWNAAIMKNLPKL